MKAKAFTLALCLTGTALQAQTTFAIDQPLGVKITRLQVFRGWDVRLVNDTVNAVTLLTPCEYYFAEGNEPQICRQDANGWLSIWENHSMPKGTVVEVHLKDPLQELLLRPGASLTADTLRVTLGKEPEVRLRAGATLNVRCLQGDGLFNLRVDSAAVANIGLLSVPTQAELDTRYKGATLMIDSLDCPAVHYTRNKTAIDNLPATDTARHLTVSSRNGWLAEADFDGEIDYDFIFNATGGLARHNSPYATTIDFDIALPVFRRKPVHINWTSPFAYSWGMEFGYHFDYLINNVKTQNHFVVIDEAANNRHAALNYFYFGVPFNLHYILRSSNEPLLNIRLGIRPTINFFENIFYTTITPDNKSKVAIEHIRDYNHFNLRLNAGLSVPSIRNIELGFFVDLLPTYRSGTSMSHHHAFGTYIRF